MGFRSEIVGCFSQGAMDNPTSPMISAGFAANSMDWIYVNCEVAPADLAAAVAGAKAMGWRGFHLSIPHKVGIIDHVDRLGSSASIIGAVNTVVVVDDELVGENTDGQGFVSSLTGITSLSGASLAVLGAGGAARAVAVESALAGAAKITILSRRADPAEELVAIIKRHTEAEAESLPWTAGHRITGVDLVVNANPVGMAPDIDRHPDVDLRGLSTHTVVADLVPNPALTRFLSLAAGLGHRVVDGTGMLVDQAIESVRLWSHEELDQAAMRSALEAALGIAD